MMNPDVESFFLGELKDREVVLWQEAPRPGRLARQGGALMLFGIPWMAFSTFMFVMVSRSTDTSAFEKIGMQVFVGAFLLIGLLLLTSPLWFYVQAKHKGYVITNRRAVSIARNLFGEYEIRSVYPGDLRGLTRTQRSDGSGDIIFESYTVRDDEGERRKYEFGFYGISDAREVEALLTELSQPKGQSA
jgi:hypothetical protein